MKKLITLLLILTLSLSLFACNEEDGAPEGMKLAADRDALGFALFIPEEWTTSSYGVIGGGYVSGLDTSSVTLVRVYPEAGESALDYMHRELAGVSFTEDGREILFGNAAAALSFVYERAFGEYTYRIWQIIATASDGASYLFTYSASTGKKSSGKSYYDENLDRVKEIVSAVVLDSARDYRHEEVVYATDAEGYKLISDAKLAGFSLYVPAAYVASLQTGIVVAAAEDGASVTCAEATSTGTTVNAYYENRLAILRQEYGEVTEITPLDTCSFANAKNAACAVYSYTKGGTEFTVYQVIAVAGSALSQKGYVLTFTAPSAIYEEKLGEFERMMEKFSFR